MLLTNTLFGSLVATTSVQDPCFGSIWAIRGVAGIIPRVRRQHRWPDDWPAGGVQCASPGCRTQDVHCYDIPGLPRSNLDLESTFGSLRRSQRRISGRKETTPIRVFGPGAITLLALDDEEILPLLQSVPPDTYWSQRHQQEECEEPHRWLTRLHRDPTRALSQVDEQFYQVVNARAGASSDVPDS